MGSRAQARQQGSRGLPLRPRRAAGEGAARRPRGCCGQWWPAAGTPLATPPQVWCGPRGLARRSARPWRCSGCSRRSGAPRCRPPRLRCHWHWRGPVSAAAPARPLGRGQPRPGRRASRPRPPTQRSYRGGPAVQRCAGGAEWSPGRQASRNSTRLRGSSLLPGCAHGGAGPGAPGFQVPHPAPQVQRAPGHLAGRRTPAAGLPRLDDEDGASARPTPAARGLVAGVRRHTARADEGLRWLAGALQLPVGVQLWPPHLPSGSAVGRAGAHRLAGRGR